MKPLLTSLILLVLMSSCASYLNEATTKTTIYTTQPSLIVFNEDTVYTILNQAQLVLKRQNKPLEVLVLTDSLKKNISLKPKNSLAYYGNIFTNYGIGIIWDKDNPKRYTYPQTIYLNSENNEPKYFSFDQQDSKGNFLLHLSLPHINGFRLNPEGEETKINTGFWGLSIGLDYHHHNGQFLNLSGTAVADFFVPVPAPVRIEGNFEQMRSKYVSLSNNHQIHRFSFGYGLSYVTNSWQFRYNETEAIPMTREPITKESNAFGLVFSTYVKTSRHFNLGLVYRPTFLRTDSNPSFKYEHLISLDFAWKINLNQT